jgi:hypothetical protein
MSDQEFTVKDHRHFSEEGQIRDGSGHQDTENHCCREKVQAGGGESRKACPEQAPLPEVNFATFVFSLSTSALIHLGEIAEPSSRRICRNLPLAKQTIDILGMLKKKTVGNLDAEEDNLLTNLLYELRMKYVTAVKD